MCLGKNKQRHHYFKDIAKVKLESNGTKVTFNDGSHLHINRYMGGEKDFHAAIDPFYGSDAD